MVEKLGWKATIFSSYDPGQKERLDVVSRAGKTFLIVGAGARESSLAEVVSYANRMFLRGLFRVAHTYNETEDSETLSAPLSGRIAEFQEHFEQYLRAVDENAGISPDKANLFLHLHGLNDEVRSHNQGVDKTLWITVVHILLAILTLGIFSFRDTMKVGKLFIEVEALVKLKDKMYVRAFFSSIVTIEDLYRFSPEEREQIARELGYGDQYLAQREAVDKIYKAGEKGSLIFELVKQPLAILRDTPVETDVSSFDGRDLQHFVRNPLYSVTVPRLVARILDERWKEIKVSKVDNQLTSSDDSVDSLYLPEFNFAMLTESSDSDDTASIESSDSGDVSSTESSDSDDPAFQKSRETIFKWFLTNGVFRWTIDPEEQVNRETFEGEFYANLNAEQKRWYKEIRSIALIATE